MAGVDVAKKAYAAWMEGDMNTVMSLMSDDVIYYHWNPTEPDVKPGVPTSGIWKNKDGVAEFFKVHSSCSSLTPMSTMNAYLLITATPV